MKKLLTITLSTVLLLSTHISQGALHAPSHPQLRATTLLTYKTLTIGLGLFASQMHPGFEDSPRWRERAAVVAGAIIGLSTIPFLRIVVPPHWRVLVWPTCIVTCAVQSYKLANYLQPFYRDVQLLGPIVPLEAAAPIAEEVAIVLANAQPQAAAANEETEAASTNEETETIEQRRNRLATAALARQQMKK